MGERGGGWYETEVWETVQFQINNMNLLHICNMYVMRMYVMYIHNDTCKNIKALETQKLFNILISSLEFLFSLYFWINEKQVYFKVEIFRHTGLIKNWPNITIGFTLWCWVVSTQFKIAFFVIFIQICILSPSHSLDSLFQYFLPPWTHIHSQRC